MASQVKTPGKSLEEMFEPWAPTSLENHKAAVEEASNIIDQILEEKGVNIDSRFLGHTFANIQTRGDVKTADEAGENLFQDMLDIHFNSYPDFNKSQKFVVECEDFSRIQMIPFHTGQGIYKLNLDRMDDQYIHAKNRGSLTYVQMREEGAPSLGGNSGDKEYHIPLKEEDYLLVQRTASSKSSLSCSSESGDHRISAIELGYAHAKYEFPECDNFAMFLYRLNQNIQPKLNYEEKEYLRSLFGKHQESQQIEDVFDYDREVLYSDEEYSTSDYEVMEELPRTLSLSFPRSISLSFPRSISLSGVSVQETAMNLAHLYAMMFAGPFLACFLVLISFATFPWQDSREDQGAWWMCMIICSTIWVILSAFMIAEFFNSAVYIPQRGKEIPNIHLLVIISIGFASLAGLWSLSETFARIFEVRTPLPFVGPISAMISYMVMVACCTSYVPSYCCPFFINGFLIMVSVIIYWGFIVLFGLVPKYWQEFAVIPFFFVGSIVERILTSAIKYLNDDMHVIARIYQIVHSDVVKLTLISTTNSFVGTLVAVLFEMLVFSFKAWTVLFPDKFFYIKNFRYPKSDSERYDIRVYLLQNLSCRDVVEIAVPPAFMICFLLVHKSSNSDVFSSVRSQEMGFEQITPSAFYYLMIYWAFDNGMLFMLSQLCNCKIRISMRKHIIMPMFQKYGKVIILFTAFPLYTMYCVLNVNCGMDFTFRFPWINS